MHAPPLWGRLATLVLAFVLYAPSAFATDPAPFAALQLDRLPKPVDLPGLSLLDLNGKNVVLRSFAGRVVLLNFWTTW